MNIFMQFIYCFLFLIYLEFLPEGDGWAVSLIWAMMILPLADALQNCFQNLTSRIAGIDSEQMTNRVVGMGSMIGFGLGAIKEQFSPPSSRNNTNINNNNISNNSSFKGFIDRAKSFITPSMNLSNEKNYNRNENPVKDILPNSKIKNDANSNVNSNVSIPTSNITHKENFSKGSVSPQKSIAGEIARTGFKATKAYLSVGAKMAEGDFSKSPVKSNNQYTRKSNYQNTQYIQNIKLTQKPSNENNDKNSGDENASKE